MVTRRGSSYGSCVRLSPEQPGVPGAASRAFEALDVAVRAAEAGDWVPVEPAPTADDWRAAAGSPGDIRVGLDRILLSDNPEAGLDAMLQIGALQALLPEVAALIGFSDG